MHYLRYLIIFLGYANILMADPVITTLNPNAGPAGGGNTVVIKGSGFLGTTNVNFGLLPATFVVLNDTLIQAIAPPQVPTEASVVVTSNGQNSDVNCDSIYTYQGDWLAYVANINSDAVSVIDVPTNTVIQTIIVGNGPRGVTITPDGTKAYVTHSISDDVSVIDLTNNIVIETIPVGSAPRFTAITPNGTKAYVTNSNSANVSVIDVATNVVISTILVGDFPRGVIVTPDGAKAYVTNLNNDNVSVINVVTDTVIETILVQSAPSNIAILPDGTKIYVSNNGSDTVSVIDADTNTIINTILVGSAPFGIAIAPDGTRAYVTNSGSNNVSVIDLVMNTVIATIFVGNDPTEAAISPDGKRVYVTNFTDDNVSVIQTASNTVITTIPVGIFPQGVAITPDQAPAASFTFTTGQPGSQTFFDASSSRSPTGQVVLYAWDFGDGKTTMTSSSAISHVYDQAGDFTVTLTVTNSAGTSTTQVFTGQTVSHQGGPTAICSQVIGISPLPPSHLRVEVIKNKFATQTEYVHRLTWTPSPSENVIEYQIFRNGKKIAKVSGRGPFVFEDHDRKKKEKDIYTIFAVGDNGLLSVPLISSK